MFRNKLIGAVGAALVLDAAGTASAGTASFGDPAYDWWFTSSLGTVTADGVLTESGGAVLTFTGTVVGVGPITSFTPGSGDDGTFQWDNIVYPTTTPHVDYYGILFDTSGLEWNIYNGIAGVPTGYYPNGDTPANSSNNYGGTVGTFNLSAVPELSTWAMMLAGFAALGFAGYRTAEVKAAVA